MNSSLLRAFCEMVDRVPAKAVLRAVHAERCMLEEDLGLKRIALDEDAYSVLSFCTFLEAAAHGVRASSPLLPTLGADCYRKTVHKLVEAGELPRQAESWAEEQFSTTA